MGMIPGMRYSSNVLFPRTRMSQLILFGIFPMVLDDPRSKSQTARCPQFFLSPSSRCIGEYECPRFPLYLHATQEQTADSTSQCITSAPLSQRVKDLVGRLKAE